MAGCEKCWRDAGFLAFSSNADKVTIYHSLVEEREREGRICTPEEQCGEVHLVLDWKEGPRRCRCGKVVEPQEAERD